MKTFDNPLSQYLHRHDSPFTPRIILLLGGLLAWLGTLALLISGLTFDPTRSQGNNLEDTIGIVYGIFLIASLGLPLISAGLAAMSTARQVAQRDTFELLRLSHLTDKAMIGAFFGHVFYRLRFWLMAQAVGGFWVALALTIVQVWQDNNEFATYVRATPNRLDLWGYCFIGLTFLALHAALWSLNGVGVGLGIFFGFWWRKPSTAVLTGVSTILGVIIGCIVLNMVAFTWLDFRLDYQTPATTETLYYLLITGGFCFVPVLVTAWITFRIARYGLARATQ